MHIKPTKDGDLRKQLRVFSKIDWLHVDWLIGYGTQLQNKEKWENLNGIGELGY